MGTMAVIIPHRAGSKNISGGIGISIQELRPKKNGREMEQKNRRENLASRKQFIYF
jgi:hypothetical protein